MPPISLAIRERGLGFGGAFSGIASILRMFYHILWQRWLASDGSDREESDIVKLTIHKVCISGAQ
jgi:hypothetical protein